MTGRAARTLSIWGRKGPEYCGVMGKAKLPKTESISTTVERATKPQKERKRSSQSLNQTAAQKSSQGGEDNSRTQGPRLG